MKNKYLTKHEDKLLSSTFFGVIIQRKGQRLFYAKIIFLNHFK